MKPGSSARFWTTRANPRSRWTRLASASRSAPLAGMRLVAARAQPGEVTTAQYLAGLSAGLGWCAVVALASVPVWRKGQLGYTGVGI